MTRPCLRMKRAEVGGTVEGPFISPDALGAQPPYAIPPDLALAEELCCLVPVRAIPGLYGVTDAVSAAGMPDGEYALGRHRVLKMGGAARLPGGALAGSMLTMDEALQSLRRWGLTLADAAGRLSAVPARYAGTADRGSLGPSAAADFVVVGGAGVLQAVVAEGRPVL